MNVSMHDAVRLGASSTKRVFEETRKNLKKVARVTGLEPATSGVTGRRSNQLSYTREPLGSARRWGLGHGAPTVKPTVSGKMAKAQAPHRRAARVPDHPSAASAN